MRSGRRPHASSERGTRHPGRVVQVDTETALQHLAAELRGRPPGSTRVADDDVLGRSGVARSSAAPGRAAGAVDHNGKRLLQALPDIEVPVIGAVNRNATVHAELALLSDIVIASDNSRFQDAPHFRYGTVPRDGVHIVRPLLLGPNRGRYFVLTGQSIDAQEAHRLGVVSEVLPDDQLRERAWALARELSRQRDTIRRRQRR